MSTQEAFVFDRASSTRSTADHFVDRAKGLTWTVETHSQQHFRAIVIRSEHNEATQIFEQTTI